MPLSQYRVVEIGTGSALAYCGKIFADFGAEVIKLEPAGGDLGRREPPLIDAGGGQLESPYFAWLNTNKRSIVDASDEAIRDLLRDADVLLDARPLAAMTGGGFDHAALRTAFPGLSIVAISWFGEDGPYRDFVATDAVCRALAGMVAVIGPKDRPQALCDHQADIFGGLSSFIAAITTLIAGRPGQRLAVSIHEAAITLSEHQASLGDAGQRTRLGINRFGTTFPAGIFKCREGWLGVTANTPAQWHAFCSLMDLPEAAHDPRFRTQQSRAHHADALEALFVPRLLERPAAEWFAEGLKRRLPFAIVPEPADLLRERPHCAYGVFAPVRIGDAAFAAPVLPMRLMRTPPAVGGTAPLAAAPARPFRRARPAAEGPAADPVLPLAGIRIVDLSMGWAGPLATRHMADLGAEIIKIEGCQYPDWWRSEPGDPENPNFLVMNRNKKGITLDLRAPEGAALVKRLVAQSDAVVENLSRDVLPKLGLDYAQLRQVKPDLVMMSMAAFRDGPWGQARAYGSTIESASGLPTVSGPPDGRPMLNHFAYGDAIGGLNATVALLIALLHRRRTGEGQHVDLSLVECMMPMLAPWVIAQSATGRVGPRLGNRHPRHVPQGCFRCAGEDHWILVSVVDDAMWQRLCAVIGRPDLGADAELGTAARRRQREDEIEAAIERWTQAHTPLAAMTLLQAAGVAAGVALRPCDLAADRHLQARGFWQRTVHAIEGAHDQASLPFRRDDRPYPIRHPAPTLGEFNAEVLGGILGLTAAELAALTARGIIGTTRPTAPVEPGRVRIAAT